LEGGIQQEYSKEQVERIEKMKTKWDEYAEMYEDTDWKDKAQIYDMIDYASDQGIETELESLYRKLLSIDPDNPTANRALGRRKLGGNWVKHEDYMLAQGFVKDEEGAWITREASAKRKAEKLCMKRIEQRRELLKKLFEEYVAADQQSISKVESELQDLEEYYPGVLHKARKARNYLSDGSFDDCISIEGRYVSMVLRISRIYLDETYNGRGLEPLELWLGTSSDPNSEGVVIQLPHQVCLHLHTTIMIPAY